MKIRPKLLGIVLSAGFGLSATVWPALAQAMDLVIVEQSMSRFICVFGAVCSNPTVPGDIDALPSLQRGSDPRLQSFSFEAKAGTPAAGATVYVYRVDLSRADMYTECLAGLVMNFGPPAPMPFNTANAAQVFVITSGGLGSVAVKSADLEGDFLQFNFDGALCGGQSSLFFGLTSKNPPVSSNAMLFGYGYPPVTEATAHTPRHERFVPRSLAPDTL
jgi:hypothetical protein